MRRAARPAAAALLAALLAAAAPAGPPAPGLTAPGFPGPGPTSPGFPAPTPRPPGLGAGGEAIAVVARPVDLDLPAGPLRALGAIDLRADHPGFGGLSGLALDPDGAGFVAVSDRGLLFSGRLRRVGDRLTGVADLRAEPLRDPRGQIRPAGLDDPEALARDADGALLVAFEGAPPRIWRYPTPAAAEPLRLPADLGRVQRNSGLEALAVAADGAVLAIPERSGDLARPFPVFRRAPDGAGWDVGRLPRDPPFLVTGADIGPDGLLYVLERDFSWLGGFSWRIRRADPADWPDLRPQTLLTVPGGFDNMEAIAVWRDALGRLRLTLAADNNFSALQRTLVLDLVAD